MNQSTLEKIELIEDIQNKLYDFKQEIDIKIRDFDGLLFLMKSALQVESNVDLSEHTTK